MRDAMRLAPTPTGQPLGLYWPKQNWTGTSRDGAFEQSCNTPARPGHRAAAKQHGEGGRTRPGSVAGMQLYCMYLLAGLEKDRFQIQVVHEYDTCCFSLRTTGTASSCDTSA